MTIYTVSYDLNKKGQNYNGLYEELKKTDHLHVLDSTWFVNTNESADVLSQRLRSRVDENDYILVIKVTKPYQGWLKKASWEWINSRII
ncbi:hypothetical protein [Serratia fonticola]|uniref:hypothetical protein n=1 Tax=Serratia fonticola TaxID=47917 RepID=UPI003AAFF532